MSDLQQLKITEVQHAESITDDLNIVAEEGGQWRRVNAKGHLATLDEEGKVPSEQLPQIKSYGSEGENSFTTNDSAVASGEGSFASGVNNLAIGKASVVFGSNNIAGSKAYYISALDFDNRKIYLSSTQVSDAPPTTTGETDTTFETPTYEVGKQFNIIVPNDHYILCGTIESIENNVITYTEDSDLGFTEFMSLEDLQERFETTDWSEICAIDDYTFSVPSQPLVGLVVITGSEFVTGAYNIGAGSFAHVEGAGNLASGNFSHAEGQSTVASYSGHAEGLGTQALGNISHAEGNKTTALGKHSHAEGNGTKSIGLNSHAEGSNSTATGSQSHAEGTGTGAVGNQSHAEGNLTTAEGGQAHAEGNRTIACGINSHAEGELTYSKGISSHAEGYYTTAEGQGSHAEGYYTRAYGLGSHAEGYSGVFIDEEGNRTSEYGAYGDYSHAEGNLTTAYGKQSHAEGNRTYASGENSHAEGEGTTANYRAHAEGYGTNAQGNQTHAEGWGTKAEGVASHSEGFASHAQGYASHAEGNYTITKNNASHSEGYYTQALHEASHTSGKGTISGAKFQTVVGRYNTPANGAFVVGGGSLYGADNFDAEDGGRYTVAEIDWFGNMYLEGMCATPGADYAEYFEWLDGNSDNEDRIGLLVTLDGDKIKFANAGDEILGTVSGTVAVLGDNYEHEWNGKYLTDDFGRTIYEDVEEFDEVMVGEDEEGNPILEKQSSGFFKYPKLNPAFDPEQTYTNRANRPEWDTVGLLGKLYVRDDGTATVNGYATVGENGIATKSDEKTNMRVLSRVNDNVIRVLFK